MTTPSLRYEIEEQGLQSWGQLVGDVHLTGESGEIREHATYVDSWLACLGDGLEQLREQEIAEVELPEQRDSLVFERVGGGLEVRYGAATASFSSLHSLQDLVVAAAKRLVDRARELDLDRNGPFVAEVEQLAATRLDCPCLAR